MSSQSAPPSARVLNIDGFSWVIGERVCDMPGREVSVTMDEALLRDVGVHLVGTGHEFACFWLQTMRLSPGLSGAHFYDLFSHSE